MELKEELSTLCLDIWSHLNHKTLTPLPERLSKQQSPLSFAAALKWFTDTACTKSINLRPLNQEDALYLENLGISANYLLQNLKDAVGGKHLDPLGFQLDAVRRGAITATCPFTGKLLSSNQSLLANLNVVFYRFHSQQVFYLAVAGIGSGFRKNAIYFPESDLVVTGGDNWGFQTDDLYELKARMVSGANACYEYLSRSDRKRKTAVCLGFYHFAHHLWNELPGVFRLERKGLLQRVDKFLVLREPLGPLEQIFPQIESSRIERKNNTDELFSEILERDYFVVRVGGNYLPRAVADRVARVSSANCRPETLAAVSEARKKYQPLVWLGIRVGNRAWADQVDGLTELIASLQQEFPKLGIVFDGFSLPGDKAAEASDEQGFTGVLVQEQEVVREILEKLRKRQVQPASFNIIGLSIFDANVWAHAIDAYLSPYGSLQHKVGWFTNKHGIVHTNRTLLQHPAKYVWEAVENGIPPRYLSAASVTDLDSEEEERIFYNAINDASETGAGMAAANERVRQNPEFKNYSIDWRALHAELVDVIRSPRTKPGMAAYVMAHRVRRRLRSVLGGVVSLFS